MYDRRPSRRKRRRREGFIRRTPYLVICSFYPTVEPYLEPQRIIHRNGDLLLGTEIALRGLNRRVTEQKLDLFEITSALAAELGTGATEIMRTEVLDADLVSALLNHRPDRPVAHALFVSAALGDGPQQSPLLNLRVSQASIPVLTQNGIAIVRTRPPLRRSALKSRTGASLFSIVFRDLDALLRHSNPGKIALKPRTKFVLKFVRDLFKCKMTNVDVILPIRKPLHERRN